MQCSEFCDSFADDFPGLLVELLALDAKIAALFAQNMDDPVVLDAVNDLEVLTQGLSAKIWQKIMILDLAEES